MKDTQDVRWRQRFDNYLRAFHTLTRVTGLAQEREPSEVEQLALIQGFEFTHEQGWNVLKDYLEAQGAVGLIGSRDSTREAFKRGLIVDGEAWMDMIKARNLTSHTYNEDLAQDVADDILQRFHPAFAELAVRFTAIIAQEDAEP